MQENEPLPEVGEWVWARVKVVKLDDDELPIRVTYEDGEQEYWMRRENVRRDPALMHDSALLRMAQEPVPYIQGSFQDRVEPWLLICFGEAIARDRAERNHRFLEEALELVQSTGCTQDEAHQLVDYVYNRDVGDPPQEVGGVMVTLAALCLAFDMDMHAAGETELARIWTKVEQIRAKQQGKPKASPLPQ